MRSCMQPFKVIHSCTIYYYDLGNLLYSSYDKKRIKLMMKVYINDGYMEINILSINFIQAY